MFSFLLTWLIIFAYFFISNSVHRQELGTGFVAGFSALFALPTAALVYAVMFWTATI